MAGILDSKERLIDFILTQEGKRQAGIGQMRIEFATLTDYHTFYESELFEGEQVASDPGMRIFFEATNRYQDTVVPELVGGTVMNPIRTSEFLFDGKSVMAGTVRVGPSVSRQLLTGSSVSDSSLTLMGEMTNNFIDQRILASEDPFSDSEGFLASPQNAVLSLEANPVYGKAPSNGLINIETAPSIFADKRFSHLPNFIYMPPVNLSNQVGEAGQPLAIYPKLREIEDYTYDNIRRDLINKNSVTITFEKTSRENNLLSQWFESSPSGIEKLSIVDFGEFDDDNDATTPPKRVFFVGRIIKDKAGVETFLNVFTIVAEFE